MDCLSDGKVFSVLYAKLGYHQIYMNQEDMKKTAFEWKGAHYNYSRIPFGLCEATSTFQKAKDIILQKERYKYAILYLDDIIIFSKTIQKHKLHLDIVLSKVQSPD